MPKQFVGGCPQSPFLVRAMGFNPAWLFAGGAIGWVEPMIPGVTLFQDAAGTIPVTAPGDPVGLSKFTAGGQVGFVQATALNRPIYRVDAQGRGYLSHNGTNQWMSTPAFAWGSDEVTICTGVRKLSDASRGIVLEIGPGNGAFHLNAPSSTLNDMSFGSKGTAEAVAQTIIAAPATAVVTGVSKISTDACILRINGSQVSSVGFNQGTGNYGTRALYAGARSGSSLFFNGNRYPGMGVNRLLTTGDLANVEAWVNKRTGAY